MSLRRLLPVAIPLSVVFSLWGSSAVANDVGQIKVQKKDLSFSCNTPDLSKMTKRERLKHLFSSTVIVVNKPKAVVKNDKGKRTLSFPRPSHGSGVIVDPRGYILTNNHITEQHKALTVTLYDPSARNGVGERFSAQLIGTDKNTDLSVLKIDIKAPIPCVNFADSEKVGFGDKVSAVGHPFFGHQFSFAEGIVSHPERYQPSGKYTNVIQTTVPINPGNSGGPLFNEKGGLIGINKAIYTRGGASVSISYSVPSNMAEMVADELISKGEIKQGWAGFEVEDIDSVWAKKLKRTKSGGVVVTKLIAGAPAAKAGLKNGDVVLNVGQDKVRDYIDLFRAIVHSDPDDNMSLRVQRDGKIFDVSFLLLDKADFMKKMREQALQMARFFEMMHTGEKGNKAGDPKIRKPQAIRMVFIRKGTQPSP